MSYLGSGLEYSKPGVPETLPVFFPHSCRRGGVTFAFDPTEVIKMQGDWRNNAYQSFRANGAQNPYALVLVYSKQTETVIFNLIKLVLLLSVLFCLSHNIENNFHSFNFYI